MEQIIVTHNDNTTIKLQSRENHSSVTSCVQNVELLGIDTVDITVESATKLNFFIGDKITVIGRDYTLNTPPRERKLSEQHFIYDLQFEGMQYDLMRATYSVNVDTTTNQIQDLNGEALTGDFKMFLDVLISNMNRVFPGKWSLGTYPQNTETRTETFSATDNCLSVLQSFCSEDKYNTEFSIAIVNGNKVLNVGPVGAVFPFTFEYGRGKGIYELTRERQSSSNIITRLNVFGSSKNIMTTKYRANRLCLPGKGKGQSFIEDAASIARYGVWESTKIFEDVFPSRTGTVSDLGANELEFIDASMDFDLTERAQDGSTLYLVPGTTAKIHFMTGNLAGYEFEISSYDHVNKRFRIKPFSDENGYRFPSDTTAAFKVAVGDKYKLLDIYMPQSYIDAAEAELQNKGTEYLERYKQPNVQYAISEIDPFFLSRTVGAQVESNIIWPGDYIPVKDADLEIDKALRVKRITRDLLVDYKYSITVSDMPVAVNTLSRIVSEIRGVDKIIRINNLNDPARARRNWLSSQEVLDMIFDPEGDFYTDKIKPQSIDTTMLSVGSKSMQFGIVGLIMQPNYAGAKNRVVYSAGTLTHYAILENDQPRTWNITQGDITLGSDVAFYIYARCHRTQAGGAILFSTDKITAESDPAYYHFLIGVINSVGSNNERAISLMYGFSTVNGRFIKTGRITAANGSTYFDLDQGEIGGKIVFRSGKTDIDIEQEVSHAQTAAGNASTTATAAQSAANAAATAASNAESIANSAQTNATTANNAISAISSDNVLSAAEKPSQRLEWNTIAAEKAGINAQATTFGITTENTAYNNAFQALANYLNNGVTWSSGVPSWISDANLSSNTNIVGSTYRTNWQNFYTARTALLNAIAAKAKQLADAAQSTVDNLQVGGRNILLNSDYVKLVDDCYPKADPYGGGDSVYTISLDATNKYNGKNSLKLVSAVAGDGTNTKRQLIKLTYQYTVGTEYVFSAFMKASANTNVFIRLAFGTVFPNEGVRQITTSWAKYNFKVIGGTSADIWLIVYTGTAGTIWIAQPKFEQGNKPTDWTPAPEDVQAGIDNALSKALETHYLKTALQGSTDISGGLLATNVMLMKSAAGAITGGFSGLANDNIGMWTGGSYQQAIQALAKIILRKDGSGQLSGGRITWNVGGDLFVGDMFVDASGALVIRDTNGVNRAVLTRSEITTLASIAGSTQNNTINNPGNYYGGAASVVQNMPNLIVINNNNSVVTVNTSIHIALQAESLADLAADVVLEMENTSTGQVVQIDGLSVHRGFSGIDFFTDFKTVNRQVIMPAGTWRLRARYAHMVHAGLGYFSSEVNSSTCHVFFDGSSQRTEIGRNGIGIIGNATNYSFFGMEGGVYHVVEKCTGVYDRPGVLATGNIASNGVQANRWGAKASNSNASQPSTGLYDVPHMVGNTTYFLNVSPIGDGLRAHIISKSNNSFRVQIRNSSGTAVAGAFDYQITGQN